MVIGRTETLGRRAVRLVDRVGARIFPNAQNMGAARTFSAMQPTTPISPALRPDQIKKVDLPTIFAMEAAPGSPAVADGSNRSGQTVYLSRKLPLLQRLANNPVTNIGMKIAGAGLVLYALPFAPVTAAGVYYFTLPLMAAGLKLVHASLGKPLQERLASLYRGLKQANAALPRAIRFPVYALYGLSIIASLSNPVGFAALLATGITHLSMLAVTKAKYTRESAPLDEKIAKARDVATLSQLVAQAKALAQQDSDDPDHLRTLKLVNLQLRVQHVYLEGSSHVQLREEIDSTSRLIADKIDELSPPQGS